MILTCERCETRFRLDESRLPARGARVRCSRCKHAFFVRPPGATQAAAIEELADQGATLARPAPPEPSWDLEESDPGSTIQRPKAVTEAPSDFEDESDWRFEDELPQLGDSGASLDLPNGEALPNVADANESSFAELGDPESWDLLSSGSNEVTATRAAAAPAPAPASAPVEAMEKPAPPERAPAAAAIATPRRTDVDRVDAGAAQSVRPPIEPPAAARAAGWMATACLVVALVAGAVRTPPASGAPRLGIVSVGSLELAKVSARLVENALAGPIWVVSGELRNPASKPRALEAAIGVALLDASGEAIGAATAIVQPSLPVLRLREEDPLRLRETAPASAAALAFRVLEPGARVPVDAVFASAPRAAAQIAVASHPVRRPPASD
ncbi:MAG: hypothetical protein DCC71_05615 [Proteobacteria bacterium]|nr:MAG: hypothetical protein DCC71_05615 [Pseudomonadota bacterium]